MLNRCLHTGICTDPTQMTLELLPLLKAGSGTVEGGGSVWQPMAIEMAGQCDTSFPWDRE